MRIPGVECRRTADGFLELENKTDGFVIFCYEQDGVWKWGWFSNGEPPEPVHVTNPLKIEKLGLMWDARLLVFPGYDIVRNVGYFIKEMEL